MRSEPSANKLTIRNCGQQALHGFRSFFGQLIERQQPNEVEAQLHTTNRLRVRSLNRVHLVGIGLGGTIGRRRFDLDRHRLSITVICL